MRNFVRRGEDKQNKISCKTYKRKKRNKAKELAYFRKRKQKSQKCKVLVKYV